MLLQSFSNLISRCWLDHEGLRGVRKGDHSHGTGREYILAESGCKYGQTDVKCREGTLNIQNLPSLKIVLAPL
jgi:hypothetical protein